MLFLVWAEVQAAPVGQVTNLSGPLFAVDAKGGRRILSVGANVEPGETLITEGNTYAQVRFVDKGVVTLKPGTQFKIESFAFDEKAPEKDGASFGLLKGALRTVTGMIGKRGNQDAYKMNTATATIGIRGTQFLVEFVPDEETVVSQVPYALPLLAALDARWFVAAGGSLTDVPTGLFDSALPPLQLAQSSGNAGTYVVVFEGMVAMTPMSTSGLQGPPVNFTAGTAGYAPVFKAPNIVPPPPVKIPPPPSATTGFTPPPSFQSTQQQGQQAPAGQPPVPVAPPTQQQNNPGSDCVVR